MYIDEMIQCSKLEMEMHGLRPFDKNFMFYFDETNNIRKFILKPSKETKVNDERGLQTDFILGGICFKSPPNYEELFNFYISQGIVNELKSEHLFRHGNYQYDFKGERVTVLLKWLEKNHDAYIHYAIENNLYFALVDIVDSLYKEYPFMQEYAVNLKDALYRVCKLYQDDILDLLCQYEFPNISKDNIKKFTRELSDFIGTTDAENDVFVKIIKQMLRGIQEDTDMPFIIDNEPYCLQDGYSALYSQRMVTFRESSLYFDEEREVIKKLEKIDFINYFPRCSFVDSANERFIQISDCIIACLSKTFQFLDSIEDRDIFNMKIDDGLKNNLRLLQKIIDRSDKKNRLLILNVNAQSLINQRNEKLAILCRE